MRSFAGFFFSSLVAFVLGSGCSQPTGYPNLSVTLVDANGANPLASNGIDGVRVFHREGDAPFDVIEGAVANGTFDVTIPIAAYGAEHELRYELLRGTQVVSIGATPSFYPSQSQVVRSVVAPPTSCVPLALPATTGGPVVNLPRPRKDFATAPLVGYAFLVGGSDATAPTTKVDFYDGLVMTSSTYPAAEMTVAPGRAHAAVLSIREALVLSENDVPFVLDLYGPYHTPVALHDGAGYASAAVSLGGVAAAVVGGVSAGQPVRDVSFVTFASFVTGVPTFTVTPSRLSFATSERAVTTMLGAVWAASHSGTDVTLERVARGEAESTVLGSPFADGVRSGGLLVVSSAGDQALLLGGADAGGQPRTDTVWWHGCPAACVAEPGPTWADARGGVATDPSGVLAGGDGPSALVERVTFVAAGPRIDTVGTLATPRRAPGLDVLPSGVVYVIAGEGPSGALDDTEQCVPSDF